MNVSAADILSAYIFVFGRDMDKNKPFAKGADEIIAARKDWRRIMQACEDVRVNMQREGCTYPDYKDVAERVKAYVAV